MNTAIALLVAVSAVCAISRPPGPTMATSLTQDGGTHEEGAPPSPKEFLRQYLLPQLMLPHYLGYEESPRIRIPPPEVTEHDWLNREIARLNQMEDDGDSLPYEDLPRWLPQGPYIDGLFENPIREHSFIPEPYKDRSDILEPLKPHELKALETEFPETIQRPESMKFSSESTYNDEHRRKLFALTPLDKEYYEPDPENNNYEKTKYYHGMKEGEDLKDIIGLEPPRQIRQNPNLSKTRNLVADDLDRLRARLANKDFRLPVSLLPTNLHWLRIDHPVDDSEESSNEEGEGTEMSRPIHSSIETAPNPAESIYGVALIAAIGAAITMAVFGFAFGWYTLSKKAKAAADVDYPAYGVTGPTLDTSGDRKLAHSAHMYHYQHQKQQIIAMERSANGLEQRNGSVSDPESEEENEEGDYTVYECPGFATTGDMEVKNPLFSEDPTPATPGKCEVVKPQPKD